MNYFQSGVFGVSLFFIISGFIIPYTLEKSISLKVFWLRRIFRLYPLYFFCLLWLITLGLLRGEHFGVIKLALNLLMINEPASLRIIGLSWTLTFEVIFYLLLSGLFLLKWHKKSVINCSVLVGIALVLAVVKHSYVAVVVGYFILFFSGNILHQFYRREISGKIFYLSFIFLLLALVVINYYGLSQVSDSALGSRSFVPRTTANLLALILFLTTLYFRHSPLLSNRVLFLLGEMSYSIYLIQVVSLPLFSSWYLVLLATLFLAGLTHYCIERPFIRYGHNLSQRLKVAEGKR